MYHGNEILTNGISTNIDYDNYFFTYSSYKTKFGIKGGLWAYIIMQLSDDISQQANSKTTYTKSVKDQYNQDLMVHLTRNVGFYKYDFGYNSFIYSLRKF